MGRIDRLVLLASSALLLAGGAALAGDMSETPYMPNGTPYEFGTAWYLRGDIGYKLYTTPHAHFDVAGYGNMNSESLSSTGVVGFGVGYKLNDWFRTDLTVDYEWPGHFHGRLPCPPPPGQVGCTGAPVPEFSDQYADISAWTTLVNAYVDMPLFGGAMAGLTPYLGAGIGAADLTTKNVHALNPDGSPNVWPGASKWNFAWSLTAGVSYALGKDWLVDANYRYVNLGNAASGPTATQFNNEPIHYDSIQAKEFRIGLRYMIN